MDNLNNPFNKALFLEDNGIGCFVSPPKKMTPKQFLKFVKSDHKTWKLYMLKHVNWEWKIALVKDSIVVKIMQNDSVRLDRFKSTQKLRSSR